jgi:hypothetical protein
MKRWALLVVLLYGAMLLVLAGPVILAAALPSFRDLGRPSPRWITDLLLAWPLWAWIGIWTVAQAALLVVPVRITGGRPVRKRHIFWTILATLIATGAMIAAMALGVWEYVDNTPAMKDATPGQVAAVYVVLGLVGVLWLAWSILFAFYGGKRDKGLMPRVVRFMLAGSILELLVAVPTHAIARWRGYCCAGFFTFWGLATGVSVLLLAFGPGVLMLFVRRYRDITPPLPPPPAAGPQDAFATPTKR